MNAIDVDTRPGTWSGNVTYQFAEKLLQRRSRFALPMASTEEVLRVSLHNSRVQRDVQIAAAREAGDAMRFRSLSRNGMGTLPRRIREYELLLSDLKRTKDSSADNICEINTEGENDGVPIGRLEN
jgi:hypothetical protein